MINKTAALVSISERSLDLGKWSRRISGIKSNHDSTGLHPPKPTSPGAALCPSYKASPLPFFATLSDRFSSFPSKGFSVVSDIVYGKALHCLCLVNDLSTLPPFLYNTLINMYLRFSHPLLARHLFDRMPHRTPSSYNTIISGLVKLGSFVHPFLYFKDLLRTTSPNAFAVASLMSACDRAGDMFQLGLTVHGYALKLGIFPNVFVGTSILHFYGSCRMPVSARKVFDELPHRNVVSWTSLMVGYMNHGDPLEVVSLYQTMRRKGCYCNANNVTTVLTACTDVNDLFLGHQIVAHAVKYGVECDVSVCNTLIAMYGTFDRIHDAVRIFRQMATRDTISWNSLVSAFVRNAMEDEALHCFQEMRLNHVAITSASLSSLLSGCCLKYGRRIHCLVVKLGFDSNVCVCNALLSMYSSSGETLYAETVFHEMLVKDGISWNSIITCYSQNGSVSDALETVSKMRLFGQEPDYVSYTAALSACVNTDCHSSGKALHCLVIVEGLENNVIVGNALVTMYSSFGMMKEASKAFHGIRGRDEVTWNALIGGYADNEDGNNAIEAFRQMRAEGVPANYITITNVLGGCVSPDSLSAHGMAVQGYCVVSGLHAHRHVRNSVITMYGKCGDVESSRKVFDEMRTKDEISWNALISANVHSGSMEEALKILVEMRKKGVEMCQFSFSESISAAAKLAMLQEGQQLHTLATKLGFMSDDFVVNAAMDMYGKCGELDDMLNLLPSPIDRTRLSWNITISSLSRHGRFADAIAVFHQMIDYGVQPDHVTFVGLLSACNHGGLVDEGFRYYNAIRGYRVPVAVEHCVCIIDLLGRAGRLKEAEDFINSMPIPANGLVWRSLLSACKVHGNLAIGRRAAENLMNFDPGDSSAYVLLANMCATTGKWEDLERIRKRMGSCNVVKPYACSWVKKKGEWSSFGVGDTKHSESARIYLKLEEVKKKICESGYVPDTRYSLQDTDEEQKEHGLWHHSERLGFAFGLLDTPESSTIKIFKNLRICGDCHSFFKFVSGCIGRKIILRDPYRFHHFSDGACTCGDYW